MKNRIVVLGGSFNPPTIAHFKLMKAAVKAVDARLGIFVPTSFQYVARKMKKRKTPQAILSDETRLKMLESFCGEENLTVDRLQMDYETIRYDYEMLTELQEKYPQDQLYFVTGSDKLYVLPRWHKIDEFLKDFCVLVAKRGEDNLEEIKSMSPYLAEHWDRFVVFSVPDDIRAVSSSSFWERLYNHDKTASEMVTEAAWELLDRNGRIPWNAITDFHEEEYKFLSNFYECPITYQGLTYGSGESAFQAQKCMTKEDKSAFTEYGPSKSKEIGRKVPIRPDWEQVKIGIMEEIVRQKFVQNPELAASLLETGDKVLIEGHGRKFCVSDFRQTQEYHSYNVHNRANTPCPPLSPSGWNGMRAGTA